MFICLFFSFFLPVLQLFALCFLVILHHLIIIDDQSHCRIEPGVFAYKLQQGNFMQITFFWPRQNTDRDHCHDHNEHL